MGEGAFNLEAYCQVVCGLSVGDLANGLWEYAGAHRARAHGHDEASAYDNGTVK
jgi:hypothetical protein